MVRRKKNAWVRDLVGITALRQLHKMSGSRKQPIRRRLLLAAFVYGAGRMIERRRDEEEAPALESGSGETEPPALERRPRMRQALRGQITGRTGSVQRMISGKSFGPRKKHPVLAAAKLACKVLDTF